MWVLSGVLMRIEMYLVSHQSSNKRCLGISALVKIHVTENPITNKGLLYLKTDKSNLTPKQKSEILNQGSMDIKLKFVCEGIYLTKDGKSYLTFRIVGMKKLANQSSVLLDDF